MYIQLFVMVLKLILQNVETHAPQKQKQKNKQTKQQQTPNTKLFSRLLIFLH